MVSTSAKMQMPSTGEPSGQCNFLSQGSYQFEISKTDCSINIGIMPPKTSPPYLEVTVPRLFAQVEKKRVQNPSLEGQFCDGFLTLDVEVTRHIKVVYAWSLRTDNQIWRCPSCCWRERLWFQPKSINNIVKCIYTIYLWILKIAEGANDKVNEVFVLSLCSPHFMLPILSFRKRESCFRTKTN